MLSNLDRYKEDLDALIDKGKLLLMGMQAECFPESMEETLSEAVGDKAKDLTKAMSTFKDDYQSWYSEAQALVKQLLPDRLDDFGRYYEKPKSRKTITNDNYVIEDYLQGLRVTQEPFQEEVVGPAAAIPQFTQQLAILQSAKSRFESSLFDIRQLLQADLFDSELGEAKALIQAGFVRAGGVIAGVVLERHLGEVCNSHNLTFRKNNPTMGDFCDRLKKDSVIDTPAWRKIQRLGDLRNICAHKTGRDPTEEDALELVEGADKTCKTLS